MLLFLAGSIVTFALAYWFLVHGDPAAAAAVILISPVPCPTPLPC
jgi:hypothetical protein